MDFSFDLNDFDTEDTADMVVLHPATGEPTGWRITFAGPGHPKAVEQSNRLQRKRLREEKSREQAQMNGRKWKAEEKTPEEIRAENVAFVVERILGWTPVRINGEDLPFTPENATRLLLDPKKGKLFTQMLEFLAAEESFTKRSATVS